MSNDDEKFDYLRERTPEQEEAADDVGVNPDAGMPGHETADTGAPDQAPDQERMRSPQAGL